MPSSQPRQRPAVAEPYQPGGGTLNFMSHVIAITAAEGVSATAVLLQVAVILRMHHTEPDWIELRAARSTPGTLRLRLSPAAIELVPLVGQLRTLPEFARIELELTPLLEPAEEAPPHFSD